MTFSRAVRPLYLALAVILTVAATLLPGLVLSPAAAHAALLSSTPADGAVLATAPPAVEFVYNEDINPAFAQVVVRDSSGATVSSQAPQVQGPVVRSTLPATLREGFVTAAYRVTSKDGHPIAGQITFSVGTPSAGAAPASGVPSPERTAAGVPLTGTSTSTSTDAPMYLLTGAGALALMVVGGLVLWSERRRQTG